MTLLGHTQGVNQVAWSPNGRIIASAGDDKTARFFDLRTGSVCRTLSGHTSYVFTIAVSPQGNLVATGGHDECVRIWDLRTGRCLRVMDAHADPVSCKKETLNKI